MPLFHVSQADSLVERGDAHARTRTHRHLRGLGRLRLVCLEFLASLHLHGAVDNPVGSQRLQPLHLHDHHLGSADITAICCSPGVIHPAAWRSKRKGVGSGADMTLPNPCRFFGLQTHGLPATVAMHKHCVRVVMTHSGDELSLDAHI